MNGAGFFHHQGNLVEIYMLQKLGGSWSPLCVCALFIDHIGYIVLKIPKTLSFFIIKVFAKTEKTKQKKTLVSAVHSKAKVFACELLFLELNWAYCKSQNH